MTDRLPTRRWRKKELVALRTGMAQMAPKYRKLKVRRFGPKLTDANRTEVRVALVEKWGSKCHWCGCEMRFNCNPNEERFATIEHLIRKADGGTNDMDNLRLACRACNNGRHAPDNQ